MKFFVKCTFNQESIEDVSCRVDQSAIINSQMDKKLKQFDKVSQSFNASCFIWKGEGGRGVH